MGDSLDPAEVTRVLGCEPSRARDGMWRLVAEDRAPEDVDAQIRELLSKLTHDLSIWQSLGSRYRVDLFCGIFLDASNEGLSISPDVARELGARGIEIGLDIYGPEGGKRAV